jgi:TonB family protein
MNAFGKLARLILAIALGASVQGRLDAKSPKLPPPSVSQGREAYGHGTGIILMDVDYKTGKVIAVRMLESTGYPRCDAEALAAFRDWRFKPHTRSPVKTPITLSRPGNCH